MPPPKETPVAISQRRQIDPHMPVFVDRQIPVVLIIALVDSSSNISKGTRFNNARTLAHNLPILVIKLQSLRPIH